MTTERAWLAWLDELTRGLEPYFRPLDELETVHTARILGAFQRVGLGQHHFAPTTGYGYGDPGREALEKALAELWGAESALVRQQIVSGTQAISLSLAALARPGEEVLFAGEPYDTLQRAVGLRGPTPGSLAERGVALRVAEWPSAHDNPAEALIDQVSARTTLLYLQRSGGYSSRPALTVREIAAVVARNKRLRTPPVVFVDNCYGEFVEPTEPTMAGADLMAGSFIKNPGGGLAPCGGYIAGRRDLVERVASHLYAPGLAGEIGPSLLSPRLFFQGLFCAPHLVGQALRGAILCARALAELGMATSPAWHEPRTDLIQRIYFGSPEPLLRFCRALQSASPVDARAVPEPAILPGYADPIVMAGGTFIQGSSSELTFDAPLRPPYVGYWQGGLSFAHAKLALAKCLAALAERPPGK
ncbi:MAG: methionine gamma-lyase family protein [Bacteroidota bacterium]